MQFDMPRTKMYKSYMYTYDVYITFMSSLGKDLLRGARRTLWGRSKLYKPHKHWFTDTLTPKPNYTLKM